MKRINKVLFGIAVLYKMNMFKIDLFVLLGVC